MGFRIQTNVAALDAHKNASLNNRNMNTSLERLSSGLRINKAADDASGMAIADSLRNQANSLGQAISNANDGIGIVQIADKAMDEQIKILDTIKTKATQAAQDGQTADSRKAIQADIVRLMEELDNIAETTSFNGQSLLSGQYTNKKFQIGAYSNETIDLTVGATSSDKIGHARFETGANITEATDIKLKFLEVDGQNDIELETVRIGYNSGEGLGALVEAINKNSDALHVKASYQVQTTGEKEIVAGNISNLKINAVEIGDVNDIKTADSDGRLVEAINRYTDQTGVVASVDNRGRLNLTSNDGRGIKIEGSSATFTVDAAGVETETAADLLGLDTDKGGITDGTISDENYGRLSLVRQEGRDIQITATATDITADPNNANSTFTSGNTATYANANAIGFGDTNAATNVTTTITGHSQDTVALRAIKGQYTQPQADAMGFFANANIELNESLDLGNNTVPAGVTSLRGAMAVMDIADSAIKWLDKIRSDLGSVQNQLTSTVNNISVTQVNVKSAESQIRDVDFASESANFSKYSILAQSGSYAMTQANAAQQNVMRLLQ